ncbi:LEM-3-like GIY-YIG domain-containing protein [Rhodovarius sp.]|uniref:LEM-3-like GIY-YIG domain-containing protein n=1 Tax=Rhodovarius sp. TaxID=2972673 RepID=UPI0034A11D1B
MSTRILNVCFAIKPALNFSLGFNFEAGHVKKSIPQSVVEALGYYVYRLEDPRSGRPFYIGKGVDQRVLQHDWDALTSEIPSEKINKIREINSTGQEVRIVIHRHKMDEQTAYHVEAALIDAYEDLSNMVKGHQVELGAIRLDELIARYAASPLEFLEPCIIIKIEKEWRSHLTANDLYERTRRYWVCSPHKRKPKPQYALSVARGLVREVYRIDYWLEYRGWPEDRDYLRNSDPNEVWAENHLRRGFVGSIAHEFVELKLKSVDHLTKIGSQNPITYLNC